MDDKTTIKELKEKIQEFCEERDLFADGDLCFLV